MGTEVLDNVESVNIAKFIPELAEEPRDPFFNPYLDEIEEFSRLSAFWRGEDRKVLIVVNAEITGTCLENLHPLRNYP